MNIAKPAAQIHAIGNSVPAGMSDTSTDDVGNSITRRSALFAASALAATSLLASSRNADAQAIKTTAASKPPSEFTKAANKRVLQSLPFDDRTDFEYAQRGFIAGLPGNAIKDAQGKVVLDLKTLQVPADAPTPDTINPSLWRVA